jgi:hypothetical protein
MERVPTIVLGLSVQASHNTRYKALATHFGSWLCCGMAKTTSTAPGSFWNTRWRGVVFLLAASSIACLLFDFYHLCPMRLFTIFIFLPSLAALAVLAVVDKCRGDGQLFRAVMIGFVSGLAAAVAYDIFRLPFVYAQEWGIASIVPPMPLYKVFPRFGAMILGQPLEQTHYSAAAQWLGWLYHFSNGATFGVMYIAMIGSPARRHWVWAVLMAMALEAGLLFTPYPAVFGIAVTARFVLVTMAAHGIFGVGMGLAVRRLGSGFATAAVRTAPQAIA